jgi:chloride channel protein, CIC family
MSQKQFNPNHIAIFNACAIGLTAGCAAVFLTRGVAWLGAFRLHLAEQYGAFIALPLIGGIGGLLAGFLVDKFPNASGSGIPQVKASLVATATGLDMRTALVKLVGGLIAISSGLLMGREGPTVHVGAALSTEINQRARSVPEKERLLVAAGAGAGLAAAFNAPLAGVFFVLEELLKEISSSTIGTAVLACFVASVASHALHADASARHIASATANAGFSAWEIPAYLLLGVVAGVFGALFNRCVMGCLKFNRDLFKAPAAVRVATAGVVSGLLVATLPTEFHNYAGMREYLVNSEVGLMYAALAFAVFFILTVIAYGSGAPGGLFAPALAMGSCIGHVAGLLQHSFQPDVQLATFALVGMGAMFASVARVPITAIVIVFEMTQNFNIVLPLMLGCIVASTVADKLYPGSIYDRLVEWSGLVKAPTQSSQA